VVVNGLHKRRVMLLALAAGRYRVKTGRKEGRTEEGVRVALLSSQSDIPVNCGARRSWSAAGRGTAAATSEGVLAVGVCVCVCVLTTADCQCSRRINH